MRISQERVNLDAENATEDEAVSRGSRRIPTRPTPTFVVSPPLRLPRRTSRSRVSPRCDLPITFFDADTTACAPCPPPARRWPRRLCARRCPHPRRQSPLRPRAALCTPPARPSGPGLGVRAPPLSPPTPPPAPPCTIVPMVAAIMTVRSGAVVELSSDGGSCGRMVASGRRKELLAWLAGLKCENCVKPPKVASISD